MNNALHYCNTLNPEYLNGVTSRLYKPNTAILKPSGLFYSSLILAERIAKELESRGES
jgi:hypothetical protein